MAVGGDAKREEPVSPHAMVRLALESVERLARVQALSPTAMFQRACLLEQTGQMEEARLQYLELLELEPGSARALNNLGNLLLGVQRRAAARELFERAVECNPRHLDSRANLGNLLVKQGELEAARVQFEAALAIDAAYRPGHAGLSFILGELGEPELAAAHRARAFAGHAVVIAPYRGERPPITVLELVSVTGGNIRTDEFLSDRVFQRVIVTTEFYTPETVLPPHDVVVNAVGDADAARGALEGALRVVERLRESAGDTAAPVINAPLAVLRTGRCAVAERLAGIAGVRTARTRRLAKDEVTADRLAALGFGFPVLLRAVGFHGGEHFEKVETADELAEAVAGLPGDAVLAIEYLDARAVDGKIRKYRVMFVDGRLYPLHVAIAHHWKIHYFSAEMAKSAENRAEDRRFLEDMAGVLGERAMAALSEIQRVLGLEYAGIDFGLNAAGEVLVFEANATMAVVIPEKDARWDYRRGAVERIFKAVWKMLGDKAGVLPDGPAARGAGPS